MEAAAGDRLRRRRQELGLSLRELGSRVGVSASMLSQVENGRCRASVATLYRLVNELGLTLDASPSHGLFGGVALLFALYLAVVAARRKTI